MAQIHEHLSIDQLAELVPAVKEGLAMIAAEAAKDGKTDWSIPYYMHQEVGLPLLKAVHAALWARATPATLAWGYQREWKGSMLGLIREVTGHQTRNLAHQVRSALQRHGLLLNVGGKSRGAVWWLRPWHNIESWAIRGTDRKLDVAVEAQEAREEKTPHVVTALVDITTIPAPTADPEAIVAYVRKLVAAFQRQSALLTQSQADNRALRDKIDELGAKGADWESVVTDLKAIVQGENPGED